MADSARTLTQKTSLYLNESQINQLPLYSGIISLLDVLKSLKQVLDFFVLKKSRHLSLHLLVLRGLIFDLVSNP